MSKKIVLCFDGTWNRPDESTDDESLQIESNVSRFHDAVLGRAPDGSEQVKWYDKGVGTHWYDKAIGGLTGAGLEKNIIDGYEYLAATYDDGDEVYLLGFSRGAYTARTLVGMVRNCGLVKKKLASPISIGTAYGIYRTRNDQADSQTARLFRSLVSRPIPIKFVGVWDTVGALGIPLTVLADASQSFYEFHDTKLSDSVANAFQALAIDEHRKDYDACVWDPAVRAPGQVVEQRWFVGAHCNVGGGYSTRVLSDIPLRWMQQKAQQVGLGLDPARIPNDTSANWSGDLVDSYAGFLHGLYAKKFPRHYRAIGRTRFGNEALDDSTIARFRSETGYTPANDGFSSLLG